jgi:hypothetical protein
MSLPQSSQEVAIPFTGVGHASVVPPTFLERWGVTFVACAGIWILIYFLRHLPAQPSFAGLSADQIRDTLSVHRQLVDQWRDSLAFIFDLLVTNTALLIVNLLLGYLFGRKA